MKNLKKTKKKYNKVVSYFYLKKKSYLVFRLNSNNSVINNFVYKKLNKNLLSSFIFISNDKIFLNVLFNLNNYFYLKKKILKLLTLENFNYELFCIKSGKNKISVDFFENNLLLKINKLEYIKEVLLFNCILIVKSNILIKKNLFLLLNVLFVNLNLFKFNVHNTPSGV